jgi:hypothetical protein
VEGRERSTVFAVNGIWNKRRECDSYLFVFRIIDQDALAEIIDNPMQETRYRYQTSISTHPARTREEYVMSITKLTLKL